MKTITLVLFEWYFFKELTGRYISDEVLTLVKHFEIDPTKL